MLTYFDKELRDQCTYKEQMKKIIVADLICAICGSILFIVQVVLSILGREILAFDIVVKVFLGITMLFFFWFNCKGIRWNEWIKGKWQHGKIEFKNDLPNEKKKSKK